MKINGWKITEDGDRIKLTRGTRTQYLTNIGGEWCQTTKDGAPALKKLPPRDFEAVVRALDISSNCG